MHLTNTKAKAHKEPVESAAVESAGAPETEIEVTAAMIEAGDLCLDNLFDATAPSGRDEGLMCIPGGWAEAVFRAMWGKRNRPLADRSFEG